MRRNYLFVVLLAGLGRLHRVQRRAWLGAYNLTPYRMTLVTRISLSGQAKVVNYGSW